MNDPGLDDAIADSANDMDGGQRPESGGDGELNETETETYLTWAAEDRELDNFLQPTKWWFASTEIPLIAGTLGPMANAFNLCSIVEHWRLQVTPGSLDPDAGQDIDDPTWVIAINAISFTIAIIANGFLLLTMAERVSFSVAQPIVIVGWYLSSILLVCIVAIVGYDVTSAKDAGIIFSQAYYYGAIAAVLYFILSSLLLLTVWGAYRRHYEKSFHLTNSQRTLMVQTISFLVYIMLGSAVYAHIEGWRYLDALYWSDFTLLTIGIGYPSPSTHIGRGLLFPYAFGGIIILGIVIGSIRTLVLERGKSKMNNRLVEKTRKALAKRMSKKGNNPLVAAYLPRIPDGESDLTESERRRREFHAMRKVRQIANTEHRWISLFMSASSVFGLWLVGAVIFWKAEGLQLWSYFVALYFSYTSLLTIGYGDVYPVSMWGKAFFVVWSLLAVPAMTIFISNMGDTLIKQFKDTTNIIGELTILPGDEKFTDRAKKLAREMLGFYPYTDKSSSAIKGNAGDTDNGDANGDIESNRRNDTIQRAGEVLEEEELQQEEESHLRGDIQGENIHHYTYLLIRELRKMFLYINASPPKEFDYDQWTYYLKLLGEDESDAARHRRPSVGEAVDGERKRLMTEDQNGEKQAGREAAGKDHSKDGSKDDDGPRKWSWIGHRSPLLGDKDEAEWLLEALADRLERELKKRSEEFKKQQQQRDESQGQNQKSRTKDGGELRK